MMMLVRTMISVLIADFPGPLVKAELEDTVVLVELGIATLTSGGGSEAMTGFVALDVVGRPSAPPAVTEVVLSAGVTEVTVLVAGAEAATD